MQLNHAHGAAEVVDGIVVNHLVGKNLVTRKEWQKEERLAIFRLTSVLAQSRDRLAFRLDGVGSDGKTLLEIEGCQVKAELDAFLQGMVIAKPDLRVELAHPSYGVADPLHEIAAKAAKQAIKFNEDEQRHRRDASAQKPEVKVKIYDSHKDYAKDAPKMAKEGWMPQGEVGSRGKVSVLGTVAKFGLAGDDGAITGFSRKGDKITVTWVKPPKPYTPRELVVVPDVPAPRLFPHEPYFAAKLTDPVKVGQEFSAVSAAPAPAGGSAHIAPAPVALVQTPVPSPGTQPALPSVAAAAPSVADKLRQLAALRDDGIITSEEFDQTKATLLAGF